MEFSLDRFYRLNRRAIIWIVLFALLYFLRDFLLLIFLTFITGFFAFPASHFLMEKLRLSRGFAITLVYAGILLGFGATVWWVSPSLIEEAGKLNAQVPEIKLKLNELREEYSQRYPQIADLIEAYIPEEDRPLPSGVPLPEAAPGSEAGAPVGGEAPAPAGAVHGEFAEPGGAGTAQAFEPSYIDREIDRWSAEIRRSLAASSARVVRFAIQMLMAILFSYLIMLDFGRLSKELSGLKTSRLRDFYEEAGEPVVKFALSVGRGFQSIVIIAFITMLMLGVVMLAFRIPQILLLSLIVFLTSLVPVVGVVFEVLALLLVTFNAYGMDYHFWALAIGIAVVHLLIQYAVAPIVFGREFRLNMVLILIILYLGQQIGGMWGLILAVPVANYFIRDVFAVPFIEELEATRKTRAIEIRADDPAKTRAAESGGDEGGRPTPGDPRA